MLELGWLDDAQLVESAADETASAIRSRQPPLPYDPTDAEVVRAAMEAYLVWEVALPDQYARDELVEFRFC